MGRAGFLMEDLKQIRHTVQHVVSAIAAALGVDVAIVDRNFEIVATSRTFLETRGTDINRNFIRGVYRKGAEVVTNPGFHRLCAGCRYEGNCPETAEVIRTIFYNDQWLGVILMVAYTQTQKEKILGNTSELLSFLGEMANLISDEIRLQESLKKEKLTKRQLETAIDFIDSGIVALNRHGVVTQINRHACKLLQVLPEHAVGQDISVFLPDDILKPVLQDGGMIPPQELKVQTPQKLHCYLSVNPVNLDGQVQGAIICISDMSELRSTVYEFSARNIETTFEDIHGISDTIRQLKVDAQRIAANDSTILILGESGTGKELFARAIHASSKRRGQPFIAVNCGAIPENLLESELFGYDEGAFSGARKGGKPGKFEMAGDGTLFLDEIAELPIHMQVKLLRVLQDGRIERVGSITSTPVNVRIIAATNRDLEALVKTGNFRNDLFYRLNVVPFVIPPLRSRSEDIPGLARFFKDKYNEKMNKALVDFTPQAMAIMIAYRWPGNVREVQNAVEYAVNFEAGNHIRPESLPKGIVQNSVGGAGGKFLANKLRVYEQSLIDDAILRFGNSVEGKKQAARELGISLPTLYRKRKEWGSE